jgi:molybdenum cofactor guanylyltransferase
MSRETIKTRILGAVYAGGKSSRFGSDKTMALFHDKPLLKHAIDKLEPQCQQVVLMGGPIRFDKITLPDQPNADEGPLGGLCAALNFAAENLFHWVVTIPCDMPHLPGDIARAMIMEAEDAHAPACAAGTDAQLFPTVAVWRPMLAKPLNDWMANSEARALHRFFASCNGVRHQINDWRLLANINRRDDMDELLSG